MKKANFQNYLTIQNFCTNHTGKMENIISISSSTLLNTFCDAHCNVDGAICQFCYSRQMMKRYPTLAAKLERNYKILHDHIIAVDDMPILNAAICRIEAFGDVDDVIQVANYFNLCIANPDTTFAMWTKNPAIIKKAIASGYNKPENLIIIYSSLFVNHATSINKIRSKYDFIDKVFTVYDKKTAENININCGAKSCNKCRLCYRKNTTAEINEILK